jgi:UDP-glucose 4-epimerase
MKVLITGSAGRLGRQLQLRLGLRESVEGIFLRNPRTELDKLDTLAVDVTDAAALRHAISLSRPDVIVHLASIAGAACELDELRAHAVNVRSVETVASSAEEFGVSRIIFASTSAVYGDQFAGPVAEDAELSPVSTYARTKIDAENVLQNKASARLQVVILRIFNVFGESFEDSLVSKLLASSPAHPVIFRGWDNFVRDYSHVDSVVDAIELSMTAPLDQASSTFNVGSGVPTSNRQLVERLGSGRTLQFRTETAAFSYSCADISRARLQLNYTPRETLAAWSRLRLSPNHLEVTTSL